MEATHAQDELIEQVAQPEAGFSLNWQMVDGFNATVQVTMRTAQVGDWPDVMKRRAEFMKRATENGWGVPGQRVNTVQTQTAPNANGTGAPKIGTPPAVAATNGGGKEILAIAVTKMVVSHRPDGKVELGFFAPGHQYADLKYIGTLENAYRLIAPAGNWTPDQLQEPGEFPVAMTVRYTLGKPNSKGNPFKDILNVAA
jgi:hypothetical protein